MYVMKMTLLMNCVVGEDSFGEAQMRLSQKVLAMTVFGMVSMVFDEPVLQEQNLDMFVAAVVFVDFLYFHLQLMCPPQVEMLVNNGTFCMQIIVEFP